jgi:hypothetical protein
METATYTVDAIDLEVGREVDSATEACGANRE